MRQHIPVFHCLALAGCAAGPQLLFGDEVQPESVAGCADTVVYAVGKDSAAMLIIEAPGIVEEAHAIGDVVSHRYDLSGDDVLVSYVAGGSDHNPCDDEGLSGVAARAASEGELWLRVTPQRTKTPELLHAHLDLEFYDVMFVDEVLGSVEVPYLDLDCSIRGEEVDFQI